MTSDLPTLLRDLTDGRPEGAVDVATVLAAGRRRVSRRRRLAGSATALVAAAAVATTVGLTGGGVADRTAAPAGRRTEPVGPVLTPADARAAQPGVDHDLVTTHTNDDLETRTGTTIEGVTDDGRVLLVEGPQGSGNRSHLTLVDPATDERDELPDAPGGTTLDRPLALGADRLVFWSLNPGRAVLVYDRGARTWSTVPLTGVPGVGADGATDTKAPGIPVVGPDDRVYVAVDHSTGFTAFDLWSVSLGDPSDVRDEHLVVGDFAFQGDELSWTTTSNEPNDGLHTRDLTTGAQVDLDPHSGARCNQLGLQRTTAYVVLSQYCGEQDGVSDDRVQVLRTDGTPVVTLRGAGLGSTSADDTTIVLDVRGADPDQDGAYVYDLAAGDLVRVGTGFSPYAQGVGPVPAPYVLWSEPTGPVQDGEQVGAVQTLVRWRG